MRRLSLIVLLLVCPLGGCATSPVSAPTALAVSVASTIAPTIPPTVAPTDPATVGPTLASTPAATATLAPTPTSPAAPTPTATTVSAPSLAPTVAPATPRASPMAGHAGPARLYPDPALTPGDIFPGVTAREVCTPGYASSVRAVTSAEKAQVYRRYGAADVPGRDEVDHFVSLELGGSNALANLWPEPNEPRPGAHEKDRVENYLHAQVCTGAMTLGQAQDAIKRDWYAVFLKLP